ncbi:alpha/beta hydrolase [Rhodomicrobium lacus]|uniref:alpha/beta hydrolase n=1 Tax=Rhodomicrobium lacus TaxID=2498452 RepID=UPI000F8E437D|nr:alpha/beta hydrolase [Rhodomicrobium lacus]
MLKRRTFLAGAAAAALLPGFSNVRASGRTTVPLWSGDPPDGGGPRGEPEESHPGAITNIALPFLDVFAPERPNGTAVIVAGGGGYKRIEIAHEAGPAARWLTDRGITAFVLYYRLPREGWLGGPLAPLQDARRAIQLVRSGRAGVATDPQRIGVLGFSAGGHLLGLAAARSAFRSYDLDDEASRVSARPDAAALLYPVVTLLPPYDDTSTRRELIGRHPSRAEGAEWSVETHVRAHCPPMFLAQARDDTIAKPANTSLLAEACKRQGVPVDFHHFASGGHGFGMGRPGTESETWPALFEAWLRKRGLLQG